MFIEVWQNGNLLHRHEVKTLPKGFGQQWYNARIAKQDFTLPKYGKLQDKIDDFIICAKLHHSIDASKEDPEKLATLRSKPE